MEDSAAWGSARQRGSRGTAAWRGHDDGRGDVWHAVGAGYAGSDSHFGRSRDEAVPGGPRVDAFQASGEAGWREGNCAGRFSGVRAAGGRQPDGTRRLRANSPTAGCACRVWSASRPHLAADADHSAGRERAVAHARRWYVGNFGGGVYPPASTLLESLGISFYNTFDAAHLQPAPDLAIVGNIIARGNAELEEVLERKIPYRSLPEILEEIFLPGRHSIVVSGTHGKTTTRSEERR